MLLLPSLLQIVVLLAVTILDGCARASDTFLGCGLALGAFGILGIVGGTVLGTVHYLQFAALTFLCGGMATFFVTIGLLGLPCLGRNGTQ